MGQQHLCSFWSHCKEILSLHKFQQRHSPPCQQPFSVSLLLCRIFFSCTEIALAGWKLRRQLWVSLCLF